jgi:hypothetical protein
MSLRNVDFTDRELMLVVESLGDGATSRDVGMAMGYTNGKGKYAARAAGSRLAWMRKFGFLGRNDRDGKWFLTDAGTRLLKGDVSPAMMRAMHHAKEGEQLMLMRELMKLSYIGGRQETATAVRREFEHQRARRP